MRILMTTALLMMGYAYAEQADCKAIRLNGMTLSYTTAATFPKSPEERRIKFLDDSAANKPLTVCSLTFTPDQKGRSLTISAANFSAFKQLFKYDPRLTIANIFQVSGVGTWEEQLLFIDIAKRQISYKAAPVALGPTVALGVKVDGGPLQPLYYKNKVTPVNYGSSAKSLDIYAQVNGEASLYWQRVKINLQKPAYTLYETATMPAK